MMRHALFALAPVLFLVGCSPADQSFPVREYRMGDRIELGRLVYNVLEAQWVTHLGEQPSARVPVNRFLLLRVSVRNSGGSTATVPPLELLDDANRAYPELSEGAQVPDWLGILREVGPAGALQGNVIFDVNPAHYKMRVTDESQERAALVPVPLQFQSEIPEVTAPLLRNPDVPLRSPQDAP
jgi:hypothetical protein